MPELPEVECLTRAVAQLVKGGQLLEATFLRPDLRSPIPVASLRKVLVGQPIEDVLRRSKYLLLKTPNGYGIFHLGMSGAILYQPEARPHATHTHAVFRFITSNGRNVYLHFVDPRRFGRIDCVEGEDYTAHVLFSRLGPEPLVTQTLGSHLFARSRSRILAVKALIMDASVVVGVGNIYASEALFRAGIDPRREAGAVSRKQYEKLAKEIQSTLSEAIAAGGTTFRDFKNSDGNPGDFGEELLVYDRDGQACKTCRKPIKAIRLGGRSTFFCDTCQK